MSIVEDELLPKRKVKLSQLIAEMQVELDKVSHPSHVTLSDLEDINDLIDSGRMTALKFKEVVFSLTTKPPQEVRYLNIQRSSFNRAYMLDWRDTPTSIFVEVRLDKESGAYLPHNLWEVIHRTDDEVDKLLGIY